MMKIYIFATLAGVAFSDSSHHDLLSKMHVQSKSLFRRGLESRIPPPDQCHADNLNLGITVEMDTFVENVFDLVDDCSTEYCSINAIAAAGYEAYHDACEANGGIVYHGNLEVDCEYEGAPGSYDDGEGSLAISNIIECIADSCSDTYIDDAEDVVEGIFELEMMKMGLECDATYNITSAERQYIGDNGKRNQLGDVLSHSRLGSGNPNENPISPACTGELIALSAKTVEEETVYRTSFLVELYDCPENEACYINGTALDGAYEFADACWDNGGDLLVSDVTLNCFAGDGTKYEGFVEDHLDCIPEDPTDSCTDGDADAWVKNVQHHIAQAIQLVYEIDCDVLYSWER